MRAENPVFIAQANHDLKASRAKNDTSSAESASFNRNYGIGAKFTLATSTAAIWPARLRRQLSQRPSRRRDE
ncbi:hypothetical protein [Rhizobium sp. LEGMi135b]